MNTGPKYITVTTSMRPDDGIVVGQFLNGTAYMTRWVTSFNQMLASLSSELGIGGKGLEAELEFSDHPRQPEMALDPENLDELANQIRNQYRDWYEDF
jgi:hypothetical protein